MQDFRTCRGERHLVFGDTGNTGSCIVRHHMGRRLEVTAFVRPISNRRSLVEMDVRFAATRDLDGECNHRRPVNGFDVIPRRRP